MIGLKSSKPWVHKLTPDAFGHESMRAALFTIIFTLTYATTAAQGEVNITVRNIRKITGSLMVGLFDSDRDFPKKAVVGKVVTVTGDSLTLIFKDLKPAWYAISVIHDENNNGKLDTNIFGIPKEGFGFGNNAIGRFGPPSFKNARICIDDHPVKTVLSLKYY